MSVYSAEPMRDTRTFPAPAITAAPVDQGAGYTGRWTHAPVDKYGAPIVPIEWPVNPRGRVA